MLFIDEQETKVGLIAGLVLYIIGVTQKIMWPILQKLFLAALFAAAAGFGSSGGKLAMKYMDHHFLAEYPKLQRFLHWITRIKIDG